MPSPKFGHVSICPGIFWIFMPVSLKSFIIMKNIPKNFWQAPEPPSPPLDNVRNYDVFFKELSIVVTIKLILQDIFNYLIALES